MSKLQHNLGVFCCELYRLIILGDGRSTRLRKLANINKTKVFAPVMWWVVVSCFLCFKLNLVWIPNSSSSILTATNNFWIALRLATYILTCLERFFGVALIAVGLNAPWTGRDDGLMCLAWPCGKDIWLQIIGLEGKRSSLLVVCMNFVLFLQQR